jgi:hypothetical protein
MNDRLSQLSKIAAVSRRRRQQTRGSVEVDISNKRDFSKRPLGQNSYHQLLF